MKIRKYADFTNEEIINDTPESYIEISLRQIKKKIDKLESGMEELLELANKSKGGFWMGMVIASGVGGIITYITSHWTVK